MNEKSQNQFYFSDGIDFLAEINSPRNASEPTEFLSKKASGQEKSSANRFNKHFKNVTSNIDLLSVYINQNELKYKESAKKQWDLITKQCKLAINNASSEAEKQKVIDRQNLIRHSYEVYLEAIREKPFLTYFWGKKSADNNEMPKYNGNTNEPMSITTPTN